MKRNLCIWGPPPKLGNPDHYNEFGFSIDYKNSIPEFLEKCKNSGVTKIIGGDKSKELTEEAHKLGILLDPYDNFNSFPRHGFSRIVYTWSLDFLALDVNNDKARDILNNHKPIFYYPRESQIKQTEFSLNNKGFRTYDQSKNIEIKPGQDLYLSLAYKEVVDEEIRKFNKSLTDTNGDGLQIEFVLGNEDSTGTVTYGYDDRVVNSFKEKTGIDPFEIENSNTQWVEHRAEYVTNFLVTAKNEINKCNPKKTLSATVIAGESDSYIKKLQNLEKWFDKDIFDEFYLWFRTNNDYEFVKKQTKYVSKLINERIPLIVELSAYHPNSFQDDESIVKAGKIAIDNGASGLGIYRSHAVEQLNLWDALSRLGDLTE